MFVTTTCEPEGTGIHNVKSNVKKTKKNCCQKTKVVKKEIKPEVVNVYTSKPNPKKIGVVLEIIDLVDKIGNELETNKVLEKTLYNFKEITTRHCQLN